MFYFNERDIQTYSFTGVEAAIRNAIKNMFLKFRNTLSKISVLESLFNKVAELQVCNFIKKWLQHTLYPVNIAKEQLFYRTPTVVGSQVLYKKSCSQKFYNFTKMYLHRSPF